MFEEYILPAAALLVIKIINVTTESSMDKPKDWYRDAGESAIFKSFFYAN